MAALIALATLLPNNHIIYGSPCFSVLWGAIVFFSTALMVWRKLWRRPALFTIHAAFIVILAGALATSLTSRRGTLHLRQGIPTDMYMQSDGQCAFLPHTVRLDSFRLHTYSDTQMPKDYVSYVTFSGRQYRISMNNIALIQGHRLYQSSYDEDMRGTVLSVNYDPWGTPLTYAGYLLFLVGFLATLWHRTSDKTTEEKGSTVLQWVRGGTLLVLFVWFVVRWFRAGYIPLGSVSDTLHFAAICLLFPYVKSGKVAWVGIAFSGIAVVLALLLQPNGNGASLIPVLRSPWLGLHVSVVMLSYALLVLSFFHRPLLRVAVGLLAVGIFLGAVWANISWGSYWSWDPKEAWALITLIVYSMPLHKRSLPWFGNERNYRLYSLLAFSALLMTYFGVSYFLGGMHSYI